MEWLSTFCNTFYFPIDQMLCLEGPVSSVYNIVLIFTMFIINQITTGDLEKDQVFKYNWEWKP